MGFNFPNTPSPGDIYQPVGGPSYTWDNEKWVMTGSPLQVTPAYSSRNRIVNGAMQISQENGDTAGIAVSYYPADQWYLGKNHSTGTMTIQRVQVVTPRGSRNRIRLTANPADASLAAGEYLQINTKIEGIRIADFGWGAAGAKQVILRFGFRGPAGTYAVSPANGAGDRSYVALFTISAAQANTDTEQTFVIPGDVTGTWTVDNTLGMYVRIVLAGGTTYQGVTGWQAGNLFATTAVSNGMATVGNTFELFDVGLYLDPQNTGLPPAWEMPDEASELAACQRYWQRYPALVVTTNTVCVTTIYPVPFRTAPAATGGGAGFTNSAGYYHSGLFNQTTRANQDIVLNARM